jgi:2-oxoglutarate ferredoxin oxidoreductase subunit delta
MTIRVTIDGDRCKGCGLCVAFCPHKHLRLGDELNSRGVHVCQESDEGACVGCRICTLMCPDVAITITREDGGDAK